MIVIGLVCRFAPSAAATGTQDLRPRPSPDGSDSARIHLWEMHGYNRYAVCLVVPSAAATGTQDLRPRPSPEGSDSARIHLWRRERDSNPRDPFGAYAISSRAPSTTRPSLRESQCRGMMTCIHGKVATLPAGRGMISSMSREKSNVDGRFHLYMRSVSF